MKTVAILKYFTKMVIRFNVSRLWNIKEWYARYNSFRATAAISL